MELKVAYLLLIVSIICSLFIISTFFINFKYIPWNTTKFGLIWTFTYLGLKSFHWIKKLKNKE